MDERKILQFPYQIKDVTPEEQVYIDKVFGPIVSVYRLSRVGPKGFVVYEPYKKEAANIYNMSLRPSDIFVVSFIRSGPYAATTSDATIMSNILRDHDSAFLWFYLTNDVFILDRGFRDALPDFEECGYEAHIPPSKYRNNLQDLAGCVRRVAKFLGKSLKPEDVECLSEHLSFENFKNNKSINQKELRNQGLLDNNELFIRKGGWRDYFDEEMTKQAERWIKDNLRGTDLHYPHIKIN